MIYIDQRTEDDVEGSGLNDSRDDDPDEADLQIDQREMVQVDFEHFRNFH